MWVFFKDFKCKLLLHIPSWRLGVTVRQAVTPRWWCHWSLQQPFASLTEWSYYLHAWVCQYLFWLVSISPTLGPNVRNRLSLYLLSFTVLPTVLWAGALPNLLTWKLKLGGFTKFSSIITGKWREGDSNSGLSQNQSCALGLLTWVNPKTEDYTNLKSLILTLKNHINSLIYI